MCMMALYPIILALKVPFLELFGEGLNSNPGGQEHQGGLEEGAAKQIRRNLRLFCVISVMIYIVITIIYYY